MGSEIELESKVGEGSFFYFDIGLDLAAETSCPPQKVQQPPATTSPARLNVLVAEDNPTNVYVVTEFLVDAEHIVHHAANGRIAVEMAQAEKYDIILMDISMPEMDGLQATSAIRSGEGPNRDTPIIALTAHTVSGDEKKFRGVGMTGYVSKPIRRDLLLQALTSQTTATPAIQRGAEVSGASSSPVLDLQDFKAFAVERKIERVLKTIEIFTAELRAKVAQLDAISEIHDTRALQDLAHSMIGSGCLLGAKQLVVISRSIEENCADSFEFPHDDARVLRHTLEKTSDKYAEIRTQAAVTSYIADGERAA